MSRLRQWAGRTTESMRARARRHDALLEAQTHLDRWRDYGDPRDLDAALTVLRSVP